MNVAGLILGAGPNENVAGVKLGREPPPEATKVIVIGLKFGGGPPPTEPIVTLMGLMVPSGLSGNIIGAGPNANGLVGNTTGDGPNVNGLVGNDITGAGPNINDAGVTLGMLITRGMGPKLGGTIDMIGGSIVIEGGVKLIGVNSRQGNTICGSSSIGVWLNAGIFISGKFGTLGMGIVNGTVSGV